MEFKRFFLEDVCTLITDGAHSSPKAVENGYKMLSVKDMGAFDFNYENAKQISEEDYNKLVNGNCQPIKNDVLIAKDGNSCLESCFVFRENRPVVLLSSIAILRPNIDIINPYYLMYYLGTEKAKNELKEGYLSGSAIPRVVLKDFKKYPLYIPSIDIQNKIVHIISLLVSKIENNASMIRNFEELSSNLFKRWFIDFEYPNEQGLPYRSSGGEMVESELGEIPKDWSIDLLSTISEFLSGGTPKTKEESYWNGEIPFFTPKDTGSSIYCNETEKTITELGLSKCNSRLYPKNTIFITARGTVGKIALANRDMAMNQSCFALQHKENQQFYLLGVISNLLREIVQGANGAVFNAINLGDLNRLKFLSPRKDLVEQFNDLVTPFYNQMSELELENIKLKQLRDSLLPKLLSGEIEIPDESVVEGL